MIFTLQGFVRTQGEVASAAILISSVVLYLCGGEEMNQTQSPPLPVCWTHDN